MIFFGKTLLYWISNEVFQSDLNTQLPKKFTSYSGDIGTVLAFLFSLWLLILSDTIRVPKHLTHKINSKSKISTGVHTLWQCSLLTGKKIFLESGLFSRF